MENIKTQGIILRSIPYSETSSIVKILTSDQGIVSCLVQGAMRKTSKVNKFHLQNFAIVDLVIFKRKSKDLYYIREAHQQYLYKTINSYPADMTKNCIFMFLNEFVNKCLKDGDTSEQLFAFLKDALITLDREDITADFHIIFLVQLSKHLGFDFPEPTIEEYKCYNIHENVWSKEEPIHNQYITHEFIEMILKAKRMTYCDKIQGCNNGIQRRQLAEQMIKFYQYHIPEIGKIKSLEILSVVLN